MTRIGKIIKGRCGAKPKYDWTKARALYRSGLNDREIGSEIGCCREVVAQWRYRNNLPTKFPQRPDGSLANIIRPLLPTHTPNQIAAIAGCSADYVRAFRNRERQREAA